MAAETANHFRLSSSPGFAPSLAVGRVQLQILRDQALPAVAVIEKTFLVVVELFAGLGRELDVRPFHDGVDRAGLLAQAAVDALDHVDVVAGRAAAAVLARLGLDRDGLSRTNGFAQLAGDAALFARRIATQGVLAAEAGRLRVALVRVDHGLLRRDHVLHGQAESAREVQKGRALDRLSDALEHQSSPNTFPWGRDGRPCPALSAAVAGSARGRTSWSWRLPCGAPRP